MVSTRLCIDSAPIHTKHPFCLCAVLSVLLWPLVVYHELIQKMYTGLEPILMKLDYSMKGDTERRKHDKKSESECTGVT